MSDAHEVTQILNAMENGDGDAADKLLPLLYHELRRLAAAKLAGEKPGLTLQATALVHEAYLRLVDVNHQQRWNSRGHFFGAAAEAMRRILVEDARRKKTLKHGGHLQMCEANASELPAPELDEDLLALDEALDALAAVDAQAVEVVKLRYFGGLSMAQSADVLNLSQRSAERLWTYAKAFLHRHLRCGG
jgi:RNA polymerase sigma factor (TIGR02999 family)